MPKERFEMYVDPDDMRWLEQKSVDTGASIAELIRRAIKAMREREERKEKK